MAGRKFVDFLPLAQCLCPQVFSTSHQPSSGSTTTTAPDMAVSRPIAITPHAKLVRMTFTHEQSKFTSVKHYFNDRDALGVSNVTNFEEAECTVSLFHVSEDYPSFQVALGDNEATSDEPNPIVDPDYLSGNESLLFDTPRSDVASRGRSNLVLINAFNEKTPWRHLPYNTHLVEYLAVVSSIGECAACYKEEDYRDERIAAFFKEYEEPPASSELLYVLHAWVAARVIPLDDPRAMWSVYRCFGATLVRMQLPTYYTERGTSVLSSQTADARYKHVLGYLAKHSKFPAADGESPVNHSMRCAWTVRMQEILHQAYASYSSLGVQLFDALNRTICAPSGWALTQLQMEISPQYASLGWQWGVLLMGLGCANMQSAPHSRTTMIDRTHPLATIQWGDVLHNVDRCNAIIAALCDCPELCFQQSTGVMLEHWGQRIHFRDHDFRSAECAKLHTLQLLIPCIDAIRTTASAYALYELQLHHEPRWARQLSAFYGEFIVPQSEVRETLHELLSDFRCACESQWRRLRMRGILPQIDLLEFGGEGDERESGSSTTAGDYAPKRTSNALNDSTTTQHPLFVTTGPLALNFRTHAWFDRTHVNHQMTPQPTSSWKVWLPAGNCEMFPTYLYAKMQAPPLCGAEDALSTCLLNDCPMSPLLDARSSLQPTDYVDYVLRKCNYKSVSMYDLQRCLQMWYCARMMSRHVRMPYDVHNGACSGKQFWQYIQCLVNPGDALDDGVDNTCRIIVVPNSSLIYSTQTQLNGARVVAVDGVLDELRTRYYSYRGVEKQKAVLVVLYAHWWTLDLWLTLMQTIDNAYDHVHGACRLADINDNESRVRLHIVGTMWMHCMQLKVHQAIYAQLFNSPFATIHQVESFLEIEEPVGGSSNQSLQYSEVLACVFRMIYPKHIVGARWIMPLKGLALQQIWKDVARTCKWNANAWHVTVHNRSPIEDPHGSHVGTSFSSDDGTKTPVDSLMVLASAASADTPLEQTELLRTYSEFGALVNLLDESNTNSAMYDLNPSSGSSLSDNTDDTLNHPIRRAHVSEDTTLVPHTLILMSKATMIGAQHTLQSVYDTYPDRQEIQQAVRNVENGAPLRIRFLLRRQSLHVVLTHYRSIDVMSETKCAKRVCWCHTSYEGYIACGTLFLDTSLAVNRTEQCAASLETICKLGSEQLYCRALPQGQNGRAVTPNTAASPTVEPLLWMRLTDPLPLFDPLSLAHHQQIWTLQKPPVYERTRTTMAQSLLFPLAQEYTSTPAQHVVLYVAKSTSMQTIYAAMQLSLVAFTMVGSTERGEPIPVLGCITHSRPLIQPIDGLWMQHALTCAVKTCKTADSGGRRCLIRTATRATTSSDDYISVEKRKHTSH